MLFTFNVNAWNMMQITWMLWYQQPYNNTGHPRCFKDHKRHIYHAIYSFERLGDTSLCTVRTLFCLLLAALCPKKNNSWCVFFYPSCIFWCFPKKNDTSNLNIDTASKYFGLVLFSKLRKYVWKKRCFLSVSTPEIPKDLVLGSFRKGVGNPKMRTEHSQLA